MSVSESPKQNIMFESKSTSAVRTVGRFAEIAAKLRRAGSEIGQRESNATRIVLGTAVILATGGLTLSVEAASPLIRLSRRKVGVIDNSAPAFPSGIEEDPKKKAINATTIHRDGSWTTVRDDGSFTIYNKFGHVIIEIGSDGRIINDDKRRKVTWREKFSRS